MKEYKEAIKEFSSTFCNFTKDASVDFWRGEGEGIVKAIAFIYDKTQSEVEDDLSEG